ncbi:MAG: hypothetical protein H7840_17070 [Alphaproteobacteria bacterium]
MSDAVSTPPATPPAAPPAAPPATGNPPPGPSIVTGGAETPPAANTR